jgi:hypothetical protein
MHRSLYTWESSPCVYWHGTAPEHRPTALFVHRVCVKFYFFFVIYSACIQIVIHTFLLLCQLQGCQNLLPWLLWHTELRRGHIRSSFVLCRTKNMYWSCESYWARRSMLIGITRSDNVLLLEFEVFVSYCVGDFNETTLNLTIGCLLTGWLSVLGQPIQNPVWNLCAVTETCTFSEKRFVAARYTLQAWKRLVRVRSACFVISLHWQWQWKWKCLVFVEYRNVTRVACFVLSEVVCLWGVRICFLSSDFDSLHLNVKPC